MQCNLVIRVSKFAKIKGIKVYRNLGIKSLLHHTVYIKIIEKKTIDLIFFSMKTDFVKDV